MKNLYFFIFIYAIINLNTHHKLYFIAMIFCYIKIIAMKFLG